MTTDKTALLEAARAIVKKHYPEMPQHYTGRRVQIALEALSTPTTSSEAGAVKCRCDPGDIFPCSICSAQPTPAPSGIEVDRDLIIGLLQARYALKDYHSKQPDCGFDKLAKVCESVSDLLSKKVTAPSSVEAMREALWESQILLEAIVRLNSTDMNGVRRQIIANRAALQPTNTGDVG